jgi:hypothetical protein
MKQLPSVVFGSVFVFSLATVYTVQGALRKPLARPTYLFLKSSPAQSAAAKPKPPKETTRTDCPDTDRLQKEVARLNGEVQRLRKRVNDLEKDQQVTAIRDQLLKEEKRSEDLHLRLLEIAEKEANLQPQLERVNQQLRPENIERAMAGVGSTKPEEARDEVRGRLAAEQQRIQVQLGLLRQEKTRIQASLATADMMIQRLRQKLAEAMRP